MGLEIIECGYAKNNTGEEYFREKIKRMYKVEEDNGKQCEAILYIQPRIKGKYPDFILIDKYRGVAILEIKDWDINFISSVDVLKVKTIDNREMINPAHQCKNYYNFLNSLFEYHTVLCNEIGNFKYNLIAKAVMINLKSNEISRLNYFMKSSIVDFISNDDLRNLTLDDIFNNKTIEIENNHINIIRCLINPEIKIAEQVNEKIEIDNKLQKLIKVLDFEQEKFAKRIVDGHYIVSGVPGSGKTIMLLARALYIIKNHPDWKIKIVCYNNSLVNKLRNKMEIVNNELGLNYYDINMHNISITTFHKLCQEFCEISQEKVNIYKDKYWKTILPEEALENSFEKYDAVLVDEYQDFYESWIKLCLNCCKKHNGKENIFLAGDRLQSIYNPKEISWKSLGINIQGRSKLLKFSYRTGKNYIQTALTFLQHDEELKNEVNKFYEGSSDIKSNDFGKEIKFLSGGYSKIGREIENLINNGYKPKDILILVKYNNTQDIIKHCLPNDILYRVTTGKDVEENKLCITTYQSSKGLENKICFLVDLDIITDKKLAYVGMTRASELLYIHANDYDSYNFASEIRDITEGKPYKNNELDFLLTDF